MCLEDIRLARESPAAESTVGVTNVAQLLIPPNEDRVSLLIGSPDTNDVFISTKPGVSATQGIRIQAGGNPLELTLEKFRSIIKKGFYLITAAGNESITYWESTFEDDKP